MNKPKYSVGETVQTSDLGTGEIVRMGKRPDPEGHKYHVRWNSNGNAWILESELSPLEKTLDELEKGDIVLDGQGREQKILAVCGDAFLLSHPNNFDRAGTWDTARELEQFGYTLKQEPEIEDWEGHIGALLSMLHGAPHEELSDIKGQILDRIRSLLNSKGEKK